MGQLNSLQGQSAMIFQEGQQTGGNGHYNIHKV